jgi:hypothetical protein
LLSQTPRHQGLWQTHRYEFVFTTKFTSGVSRPHGAIVHLTFSSSGEFHLDDLVLSRRPAGDGPVPGPPSDPGDRRE